MRWRLDGVLGVRFLPTCNSAFRRRVHERRSGRERAREQVRSAASFHVRGIDDPYHGYSRMAHCLEECQLHPLRGHQCDAQRI